MGHGLSVDFGGDYGVYVALESTDIDQFQCRWTNSGVTIVEPAHPGAKAGLEHFVPAEVFLGGR